MKRKQRSLALIKEAMPIVDLGRNIEGVGAGATTFTRHQQGSETIIDQGDTVYDSREEAQPPSIISH